MGGGAAGKAAYTKWSLAAARRRFRVRMLRLIQAVHTQKIKTVFAGKNNKIAPLLCVKGNA